MSSFFKTLINVSIRSINAASRCHSVSIFINNLSNAPDHLVSGELNDIELAATRAGNNFKTYKEVMKWAMTNVSKFEGFNLDQMIERLGVPTKYWD